jgi:hypothetical protein
MVSFWVGFLMPTLPSTLINTEIFRFWFKIYYMYSRLYTKPTWSRFPSEDGVAVHWLPCFLPPPHGVEAGYLEQLRTLPLTLPLEAVGHRLT